MTPLIATYRLQLTHDFGFDAAAGVVPYLAELGISHVYCSPYLQAAPGSRHGYDVVDPTRVNAELGGEEGRRRFVEALAARGMSHVLDIVPNHMAIAAENPWWWDVLESGQASRYATFFDVDWDPPEARLRHLILLPVLGELSGEAVDRGLITVERTGGRFQLRYHHARFPLAPRSLDALLRAAAKASGSALLEFLADVCAALPAAALPADKTVAAGLLEEHLSQDPAAARGVDEEVRRLNADAQALEALLDRQNFRLAYWRASDRDLGYRRFFDISSLIGLRMEHPPVFDATHALVLGWLADGSLAGVRVDHPDGLRDPEAYLARLRAAAPKAWVVVEKILTRGEELPPAWRADGTTGYEFARLVGGLFIDPEARSAMTSLCDEMRGSGTVAAELVIRKKRQALRDLLGSELNRVTAIIVEVCETHRAYRDLTRHELHEAIAEYLVHLPVYRTYVRPEAGAGALRPGDRRLIEAALAAAQAARSDLEPHVFRALGHVLLLGSDAPRAAELIERVQQLTCSVMAKGVEDTAFYAYPSFLPVNEVGGSLDDWGTSLTELHQAGEARAKNWPRAMLTTSTHDTKRSEDVRARLALLSEMPDAWAAFVHKLRGFAKTYRSATAPDGAAELLYFQTLVGAWPLEVERAKAFMEKAGREAKVATSWLAVNKEYEAAVARYVEGTLGDKAFGAAVRSFVEPLVLAGRITSLAQTLVKLTFPGVPDIYQGCDLWDLSLVDPDNRRPVDFALRSRLLRELPSRPEVVLEHGDAGLPKMFVIKTALAARRRHPEWFGEGASYAALATRGRKAEHVVAYARAGRGLTVVPRLVWKLAGAWTDTEVELPPGRWRSLYDDRVTEGGWRRAAELLARFPVALLVPDGAADAAPRGRP